MLDVTVGMKRTAKGFVEQYDGDARTHYSWLPTHAYKDAFGLLTYRDALPAFQPLTDGPRSVSVMQQSAERTWVPGHLVEVRTLSITGVLTTPLSVCILSYALAARGRVDRTDRPPVLTDRPPVLLVALTLAPRPRWGVVTPRLHAMGVQRATRFITTRTRPSCRWLSVASGSSHAHRWPSRLITVHGSPSEIAPLHPSAPTRRMQLPHKKRASH